MSLLYTLNHFLIVALLSILVLGIVSMLRQGINRPHAKHIILMLSFWLVVFINVYYEYVTNGGVHFDYNNSLLDLRMIILGIPCFFVLVTYPLITLNSRAFDIKRFLLNLSPILSITLFYFGWCWLKHIDPFYIYQSYAELAQNILTAPVLLRIAILSMLFFYVVFILVNLWKIVPFYTQLTKDNFSGNAYDVKWIKMLTMLIAKVGLLYFILVLFRSPITNTLYVMSLLGLFYYIVEKAEFTTGFEDMSKLGLRWSFKNGWYVLPKNNVVPPCVIDIDSLTAELDEWMKDERPYSNPGFTTAHIIEKFPQLTNEDLRKIFKQKEHTFHSFVRELRIKSACALIEKRGGETNLKEVYSAVGFSYYSSFSRSFQELVGVSPSDYIQSHKH